MRLPHYLPIFIPPKFIKCLLCASHTIGNKKKTVITGKKLMTQRYTDINQAVIHKCISALYINTHSDKCYSEKWGKGKGIKGSEKWSGTVSWESDIYTEIWNGSNQAQKGERSVSVGEAGSGWGKVSGLKWRHSRISKGCCRLGSAQGAPHRRKTSPGRGNVLQATRWSLQAGGSLFKDPRLRKHGDLQFLKGQLTRGKKEGRVWGDEPGEAGVRSCRAL